MSYGKIAHLVMLVFNPVFVLLVVRAGAWSISHRSSSVCCALTLFHFFNIELAASFSSYLTNWALRSSNACHNICYIICYARQWRFWSPTLTRAAFIQFGRHLFYSHQMRRQALLLPCSLHGITGFISLFFDKSRHPELMSVTNPIDSTIQQVTSTI